MKFILVIFLVTFNTYAQTEHVISESDCATGSVVFQETSSSDSILAHFVSVCKGRKGDKDIYLDRETKCLLKKSAPINLTECAKNQLSLDTTGESLYKPNLALFNLYKSKVGNTDKEIKPVFQDFEDCEKDHLSQTISCPDGLYKKSLGDISIPRNNMAKDNTRVRLPTILPNKSTKQ